jgi:cytidine deaminase
MQHLTHICHYQLCSYEELTEQDRNLVDIAKSATRQSYAPYSRFHVGAAALLDDGTVVVGTNQENAAYPSGMCAERIALFHANSCYPRQAVISLAIAAYHDGKFTSNPISPCGACRQVMLETEQRYGTPIRVLLFGVSGTYIIEGGAHELLPLTFDASSLGK